MFILFFQIASNSLLYWSLFYFKQVVLKFSWCHGSLFRYFFVFAFLFLSLYPFPSSKVRSITEMNKISVNTFVLDLEQSRKPPTIRSVMDDNRGCYGINRKGPLFSLRSLGEFIVINSFLEDMSQVLSKGQQSQCL